MNYQKVIEDLEHHAREADVAAPNADESSMLSALNRLKQQQKEIRLKIAEVKSDMKKAKASPRSKKIERDAAVIESVLSGEKMSIVARAHGISAGRTREIVHAFCRKSNRDYYEKGNRPYRTSWLYPETQWLVKNAHFFLANT